MKKKLILTISIIIIVALIGGIILSKKAKENTTTNQDIKYTANIKELDLTKQMKTELNKISHNNSLYYDITGSNSKNYYGVIYEEPDSGLANSIGVFSYDKSSKKLEITKHNFHSSIIGYTSYNNNYYYIALKDNQDCGRFFLPGISYWCPRKPCKSFVRSSLCFDSLYCLSMPSLLLPVFRNGISAPCSLFGDGCQTCPIGRRRPPRRQIPVLWPT